MQTRKIAKQSVASQQKDPPPTLLTAKSLGQTVLVDNFGTRAEIQPIKYNGASLAAEVYTRLSKVV